MAQQCKTFIKMSKKFHIGVQVEMKGKIRNDEKINIRRSFRLDSFHLFSSKSPIFSAIAVIPLTVNKIASSGFLVRYIRRFRYSGRRYRSRYLYTTVMSRFSELFVAAKSSIKSQQIKSEYVH